MSCVPQGDDMANDTVKWRQIKFLVYPVFVVLGVYIILYLYCGEIFTHSPYNSYTKQCNAWLNGRLDLGQNYSWLELEMCIRDGNSDLSVLPVGFLGQGMAFVSNRRKNHHDYT